MSATDSQKSIPQSNTHRCWVYDSDQTGHVRRCRNAALLTFLIGAEGSPEYERARRAVEKFEEIPGESVRERMHRFADLLPTCSPYLKGTEFARVSLCREHVTRDSEDSLIAEHSGEDWTLGLTREEILDEIDRRALAEWAEAHRGEGFIIGKGPNGLVRVKRRVQ